MTVNQKSQRENRDYDSDYDSSPTMTAILPLTNSKPRTETTYDVGCHSEQMVIARMIGNGWNVLVPVSKNSRYDFAVERDGQFHRIQVKTGRLDSRRDGAIAFPTVSSYAHRGRKPAGYVGQIDAFGVYCPETDKVYLVPMLAAVGCDRECFLRVTPARNGQTKGVRWASEYLVG